MFPTLSLSHWSSGKVSIACTALHSVVGLARLMAGDGTGAGTGTLLHSSGLKFRLGEDCSRLEMVLREHVCVSHVFGTADPLCSLRVGYKDRMRWLLRTPNVHVLLVLIFFHLDGNDRHLLSRSDRHRRAGLTLPEFSVTANLTGVPKQLK